MGSKIKAGVETPAGFVVSVEDRLTGVLKPIKARNEFVHGIARRIRNRPRVALVDRIANWRLIAILVAGLVSLALFMAVAGRALLALMGKKPTARS